MTLRLTQPYIDGHQTAFPGGKVSRSVELTTQRRPLSRLRVPIFLSLILRGCIQKFPDWDDNEICAYNNKHSLRSNTKGYGGKTY
jgi:hypothetical protein